jgi:hypothetical protein
MRRHVIVAVVGVFLASCAGVQQRADELQGKAPCCKTMAELPYQTVDLTKEQTFEFSERSPVFMFPEGKSYFSALSLKTIGSPRSVKVRVFQQGNQAFESMKNSLVACPTVIFLDQTKNQIASLDLRISKATPTSVLGPSLSEVGVWHASFNVPATAAHIVLYTKPYLFGRANAVPLYRFDQVSGYLYVPCGPTGTFELASQ